MTQENLVSLRCKIGTTDATVPLGMRVTLNDQLIFETSHVNKTIEFRHSLPNNDQEYMLKFEMSGKTDAHTKIDDQGNIIKDVYLTVQDFEFDDISIENLLPSVSDYTHNLNGHAAEVVDKFYGSMGCNGCLTLRFSTPIYLWLLSEM